MIRRSKTQAERRDEAERSIVEATIELMSQKGFAGFSLSEVGEKAGYSRALPAHYFGAKENLLLAVAKHIVNQFRNYSERGVPTGRGLPALKKSLSAYLRALRTSPEISRSTAILFSESLVNANLLREFTDLQNLRLDAIKDELRAGIESGNVRSDADIDAFAGTIYAFLRGALNFSVLDPKFPLEAIMGAFDAMLSDHLRPR